MSGGSGPRDRVQIDSVFSLKNSPCPETGRHGVAAVDTDGTAFQILRRLNSRVHIADNGSVVETPLEEDRNCGDGFAVRLRTEISAERHFTNVKFEIPHHAPHRGSDRIDLNVLQLQAVGLHTSVDNRLRESGASDGDFKGTHSIDSVENQI